MKSDFKFSTYNYQSSTFQETKREAISRDNFTTNSKRKHFMCTDRRDFADFHSAVDKLETRKRSTIKKYEEEIKDCKQIYKQFEHQKQGLIPFESLITGDQHNIKSSAALRKQNLLKSVCRSLAPRTSLEASKRPVLNYELVSKQPSVPHRIKVELSRRELKRLQEEEVNNNIEEKKPEVTSIYLDDAVAKYSKLRKELDKDMEKRSHILINYTNKDTRPVSVPSKLNGIGNEKTVTALQQTASGKTRKSSTFYEYSDPLNKAETAPSHPPSGIRTKHPHPLHGTQSTLSHQSHGGETTLSHPPNGAKSTPMNPPIGNPNTPIRWSNQRNSASPLDTNTAIIAKSQRNGQSVEGNSHKTSNTGNSNLDGKTKAQDMPRLTEVNEEGSLDNTYVTTPSTMDNTFMPKQPRNRSVVFAKDIDDKNLFSQNFGTSPIKLHNEPRSRSFAFMERENSGSNLGQRASTLPSLKSPRMNSDKKLSLLGNDEDVEQVTEAKNERRRSLTRTSKSSERRSNSITELSTDKLQEIITEKIIGQLTNVQRRQSISSNHKASILKNYTRMLQSQLKLDDVPESESPDFSETPFMRSATKSIQFEATKNNESAKETTGGSSSWKNQLQFGSFRSSLTYADIEEEDAVGAKARRRLSATFFDAAGVVTRKEKASGLTKLRRKQRNDTIYEKETDGTTEKRDSISKQDKNTGFDDLV